MFAISSTIATTIAKTPAIILTIGIRAIREIITPAIVQNITIFHTFIPLSAISLAPIPLRIFAEVVITYLLYHNGKYLSIFAENFLQPTKQFCFCAKLTIVIKITVNFY